MKIFARTRTAGLCIVAVAALCVASCGLEQATRNGADGQGSVDRGDCNAMTDSRCIEVRKGESVFHRWVDDYEAVPRESTSQAALTVIRWADMIDDEVTSSPEAFRYQIYGTDGYTFGGFASWQDIQRANLEVGTRRTTFNADAGLGDSFNVRDSYLLVLSPASD
jgi:hypothetical protein